ncbi:MAG TPA: sodium:proton antiporter [Ktedonobacteraceae bacterium]|nr:sodium:proton antiporter [Ktedonobacteraceae bacterium]
MDIATIVRLLVVLLLIALTVILLTRRFDVPYTLGLVVVGLLLSLFDHDLKFSLRPELVLFVFLPALLFEGSWSISVDTLRQNWRSIFLLSVPGLLLELVLIALPIHFFAGTDWASAFILAAVLSPTDPVAVLGLFRQMNVNIDLATIIEGESLFNDGVAGTFYQVFLVFVLIEMHGQPLSGGQALWLGLSTLLLQAGGGVLLGGLLGFLISRFVRYINDHLIETTITIVAAYGCYILADWLHMSGILAVIVAGLIIGSYGRTHGMTERTQEAVDDFWSAIAFIANALLFLLVGAQLNPLQFLLSAHASSLLLLAGLTLASVLLSRLLMVLILPSRALSPSGARLRSWRFLIFWSGLRGALSLALILALPLDVPDRQALIFATYTVVLFTLLVQGFSLRFVLRSLPALAQKS